MYCVYCGKENSIDNKFCNFCGKPFFVPPLTAEQAQIASQPVQPSYIPPAYPPMPYYMPEPMYPQAPMNQAPSQMPVYPPMYQPMYAPIYVPAPAPIDLNQVPLQSSAPEQAEAKSNPWVPIIAMSVMTFVGVGAYIISLFAV